MFATLRRSFDEAATGIPRAVWVLCLGMFINRAGSFVVLFLAVYLTQGRGFSPAVTGMVAACFGAGAMLANTLGGVIADRLGRKITMVGSLALGGVVTMLLGFAADLRLIAAGVFTVALLGEAYRPAMQAALSDLLPGEGRVRAFGFLYWAINLGFSVGATVGGLIATHSFLALFLGDGLTSLAFALLVMREIPETRPAHAAHAAREPHWLRAALLPFHDGAFTLFLALSFAIFLVFMQHVTSMPLTMVASGLSRASIGAVMAVNGVLIVLIQPWLAPRAQGRNPSLVLALGSALIGAGMAFNAWAGTAFVFSLGVIVWSVGEMFVLPIANAVVADASPAHMRGRYQGAYGLVFGFSALVAPLAGTAVLERRGRVVLWVGAAAICGATALGHVALRRALTRLREARRTGA